MSAFPRILKLDQSGSPDRWITHEDAAYYYTKGLVVWGVGDDFVTLHGGTSRMTGRQSVLEMNSIIAVRGQGMSHRSRRLGRVPALNNRALFRRDKHVCAYCGQTYPDNRLTRDHVTPKALGGADIWTNVVTSCGPCNKYKDSRTLKELNIELLYVPYAPNYAEFLILQNRNILGDQMEFLLKSVPTHSRLHS